MKFDELIINRFSVRSFTNDKIDRSILIEILEAAHMAPSAVNYQPWHFIVIDEKEDLASLHEVYPRNWFREAPACIVVCADHSQSWKRKSDGKDFADIDAAIVTDHLILKATEIGIGSCWVCNFDIELARKKLELPENLMPIVLVPLGYSKSEAPAKTRKNLSEIISWGKFKTV
jgi:nitroreductase